MILAFNVKKDKQIEIPAVTHVDGTARVQTVTQEGNLRYWKLLKAFQKQTGTPVLMNTSFNIMGEPIVNTPEQAVKCFLGCGLDTLVIGDYVISKE
jgi:carbamoyltransferase